MSTQQLRRATPPPLAGASRGWPGRGRGRRHRDGLGPWAIVAPAVVLVAATVLYPLAFNIDLSLREVGVREIITGTGDYVGLDNYRDQLGSPEFWHAFLTSLLYTCSALALTFAAGLGLAVFFNRRFPGRSVLRSLILLAWILPTVVSANVWRWLLDGTYGLLNAALRGLGLIDTDVFWLAKPGTALVAVVLATAWSFAPFAMVLLLAGLQGIPGVLYEAATVDGAGAWQRFRHVTMPALRPVSLTVALLCFIYTFKTFDTVFVMTQGGPGDATTILPIYAYAEAFSFFRYDAGAAATTLMLLVPMGLAVVYFRFMRREEIS